MKRHAVVVGKFVALALLGVLRFVAYVVLSLFGRLVMGLAKFATGVGMLLFVFCLFFRPDMATPMWAGAGLAIGGMVVIVAYLGALRLVAPAGSVILTDV
jgi:hypothetical protein